MGELDQLFAAFGVNIAEEIHDGLADAMLDAVLTKRVAGARGADVTAGNGLTSTDYPCKGITAGRGTTIGGTGVRKSVPTVSVLGKSLPAGIVPQSGDLITIAGETLHIENVMVDEAGALYTLETPNAGAGFANA